MPRSNSNDDDDLPYTQEEELNQDLQGLMLWEEQLLEMDQREEGKSERSSEGAQKVAGTMDGDDVSFQLTLT